MKSKNFSTLLLKSCHKKQENGRYFKKRELTNITKVLIPAYFPFTGVRYVVACVFFCSHTIFSPIIAGSTVSEADIKNSIKLLQVVTGDVPAIDYNEIYDSNADGVYGLTEAIKLLADNNHKNYAMTGSIGMPQWDPVFSTEETIGTSQVATWKHGKQSAISITYDDSSIGNALYAVPTMAEKGLVGTYFVNPGLSPFQRMTDVWHNSVSIYKQEIANHTMEHKGGETAELAIASISDASYYIKEHIYDISPTSETLLGFNKAGGTTWDLDTTSAEWDQRIRDLYLIERKYSLGFYKAMPLIEMKNVIRARLFETSWQSIHFHGICDDENNGNNNPAYSPSYIETCTCTHIPPSASCGDEPLPGDSNYQENWKAWETCRFTSGYSNAAGVEDCKDGGTGAVKKTALYAFFDYLTDHNELPAQKIWITGYLASQKYSIERDNAVINMLEAGSSLIRINLTTPTINKPSPLDRIDLYDEELTLFTKVPSTWTACKVTQNGVSHTYRVSNGEARYEALPNNGEIVLTDDLFSNIDIPYIGDGN